VTRTWSVASASSAAVSARTAKILPYCSRDQIRKGQWQPVTLEAPPYIPTNEFEKRCKTNQDYKPNVPWSTWEWKPSSTSCYFSSWNSTDFCNLASRTSIAIQQLSNNEDHLVHNGTSITAATPPSATTTTAGTTTVAAKVPTILFVGDSLTYEQYSSLTQLLGLRAREKDMHKAQRRNVAVERIGCRTSISTNHEAGDRTNHTAAASTWRLLSRRDDYLTNLQSYVEQYDPHILVINRGAHYVDDNQLRRELNVTISFLEQWQQTCMMEQQQSNKTCLLYVRTTAPGHPLCWNYTEPSRNTEEMEALVANLTNYQTLGENALTFHWWDIKHQNELLLEAFAQSKLTLWNHSNDHDHSQQPQNAAGGGYYQVLDAYDINLLRPDMHRPPDCLHSCYPGKMDVYNQLLLHSLQATLGAAA